MSFQNKMVQQVPVTKDKESGNSLVVQWSELSAFTARAWVQSLVGELRSHKLHGMAGKKKRIITLQYISTSSQNFRIPEKILKKSKEIKQVIKQAYLFNKY